MPGIKRVCLPLTIVSKEIIKALAQKRGSEAGLEFAEAFSIIRETESETEF